MHFRHFILMGVFLGAAAFFPNNTFANGAVDQPEPQNAAVQTHVSKEIEDPIASEKAVPVTPENVHKSQGGVVQKPATNPSTKQTVPKKPVPKLPNKTNRGIEKVVPSLEKNSKASESAERAAKLKGTSLEKSIKAVESAEPAEKVKDTGQTGPAKPSVVTNRLPEVPKSLSSSQTGFEAETSSQPPGLNAKSETFTEDTDSSASIKRSSFPALALAQKQHIGGENKTPSNNRETPGDIGIMNNLPQRTQTSGGQSNDQFSPGADTMSFIVNRFDWEEYFSLIHGQIYTSRQAKYCHQWINAPPSPPPQAAPFFLTFTAYLATCNDN
ncbi:hypothetical protein ACSU64_17415 [Bacillaceae bacterium C204]|uniref:hypothetical protein n=1 Tax=Neobacillus sp. 204 TaxID=3383351 RepID=UPI00397BFACE